MINEAIQSFINAITDKLGSFWLDLWSPLSDAWPFWWSWGVFILILLACFVIGFFLQFKWIRLVLGVIVLGAAAWLTGRVTMYNEMKKKLEAERKKKSVPKPPPKPPSDGWR